ncbi:MAG: ATP-binding protein [Candidatus Jordarchaeales archaeon]
MSDRIIGYVIGEATPTEASFISVEPPRLGEYVVLEYNGKSVLGMVQALISGSVSLSSDIHDPQVVERIRRLERGRDIYVKGIVGILGDVEELKIPRTPPPPGVEIRRADSETLKRVFGGRSETSLRIGTLVSHEDVPVCVDVNRMVSRHLAILAVTGAGKSNTVAVIADGIVKMGGTVVIFDMHSEYVDSDIGGGRVNPISPVLDPYSLSVGELMTLMNIRPEYHAQERAFREVYGRVVERIKKGEDPVLFLELLREELENSDKKEKDIILNKVDGFEEKYSKVIKPGMGDIIGKLRLGYANVVDLGQVDEDCADVVVSHTLRRLLEERKKFVIEKGASGFRHPVLTVVEEAHILAPNSEDTLSSYWISRVAREGRKFGVGLCLVSQRPKALSINALSQVNNMIILKLVEPSDQRHVQAASEALSNELLDQLSSLNTGEAVVLGMMVKVPAIVKIDKYRGKLVGADIDVVAHWKGGEAVEEKRKEIDGLLDMG